MAVKVKALITLVVGKAQEFAPGQECEVSDEEAKRLISLDTYFLVPETKGLTLEQVDKMLEESTPRTSAKWKPTTTFAHQMQMDTKETA